MYAKGVEVTQDRIKDWPASLAVVSESSSVFYDLFSEGIIEQAFSPQVWFFAVQIACQAIHLAYYHQDQI
jgi:hypothetical protein